MPETSQTPTSDRRRPVLPTLHQPVEPAHVQATVGGQLVLEEVDVLELTDRTMVVEVRDPTFALALSLSLQVVVTVDLGGAMTTLVTEPGRRASDNPTSCQVELILRDRR
jgi:hypothetical protein